MQANQPTVPGVEPVSLRMTLDIQTQAPIKGHHPSVGKASVPWPHITNLHKSSVSLQLVNTSLHLWGPLRAEPVDGSLGLPAPCLTHHLGLLFLPWTLFIYLFAEPLTPLKGAFVQADNHQHK